MKFRYSHWEGDQGPLPVNAQQIMGQLTDHFLESNDFAQALNMLFRKGLLDESGQKIVLGLDDLLRQIKNFKLQYLERYNTTKVFDAQWQKFYHILTKEFRSLEKLLEQIQDLDFHAIASKEELKLTLERILGPISEDNWPEKLNQLRRLEATLRIHLSPRGRRLTSFIKKYQNHSWLTKGLHEEINHLLQTLKDISSLEDFLDRQRFKGIETLDYLGALRLKERFSQLEALEKLLQGINSRKSTLEEIDLSRVRELLGEEAYQAIVQLRQITKLLEESGFIAYSQRELQLTSKGIREIGQKTLKDIFSAIKKERVGQHTTEQKGGSSYSIEESKPYQFGDPFFLDLSTTLRNSLVRQAQKQPYYPTLPLKLSYQDFEVYQPKYLSQSSTVLMLDMSWSMAWANRFLAAKKVAIALHNLIKTQYPWDTLYLVGFYSAAKELRAEDLPHLEIYSESYGTNMQAGLRVSSRLLAKDSNPNKQVIMITDGEPTAHFEDGELFFQYPPAPETLYQTLCEVKHCTRKGITITVFMLNDDHYLAEFVNKISQINKGRAFFTTPEHLGKYILIDYLSKKRKQIY
jgi:uncharacterized protein with von Willebrand factor type A (vWA) domain